MLETIIIIFLLKFSDCALGTVKTLMLVKNKFFLSSVANSLSALLFIFVADSMANSPSEDKMYIAVVIFIANLVGGYFPPKLIDKLEEDMFKEDPKKDDLYDKLDETIAEINNIMGGSDR